MKIIEISDYSRFKDCKNEWEDLLSRSAMDNLFLTHEWIGSCIRHFHAGDRLLILNIFNNGNLTGIAPLVIKKERFSGLPVKTVCFIGTSISDRMDFILDGNREEAIALILDYLMVMKEKWDIIDLQELAECTGNTGLIEKYIRERKVTGVTGRAEKSFFVAFDKANGALVQKFSKKFHREFERVNDKWHGLNIGFARYMRGGISEDRIFSELNSIENKSWKGDMRSGIFSKPACLDFHREIFSKFSKDGRIDLSILSLDAKPIAYMYNYLYGKRSYCYNIAYDKEYFNLFPGKLLMLWTLADSLSRDIVEFDFGRGEDPWKSRITKDFRKHSRVRIFKGRFYPESLYILQFKIKPYIKGIKILNKMWMKIKDILRWG